MQVNQLFCVGSNKFGQAGAGKKYHNQTFQKFTRMIFPVFIKQVVCGSHHSGLLTLQGLVYMMGSNINGVLGSPSNINYSYSPMLIENISEVSKICSGSYHMAAISEGRLYTWGKGVDGQLGTGKVNNSSIPTIVQSLGDQVEDVACGLNHTLVKVNSSKCYAFGNGIYGQLGIGNNKNSSTPVLVKIESVTEIAAGENFSLFLKGSTLYGAGDNSQGQISHLYKKKYSLEPTQIKISNITSIRAGKFSLAVQQDKSICIWGIKGQEPIYLQQLQDYVMDIQIGGNLVYCLTSQGQLYEWKVQTQQNSENKNNKMIKSSLGDKTVLGFAVGETHSIVIGDIVDQMSSGDKLLKVLENIENGDIGSSKASSRKTMVIKEQFQSSDYSVTSQNKQINSEHYSRTPSSIMREPHNFLKCENRDVQVTDFSKSIIFKDPNETNQQKSFLKVKKVQYDDFPSLIPLETKKPVENKQVPVQNESELNKDEVMNKINQIMFMLTKNNKIDEAQSSPISQMSRKMTKSRLDKFSNKQNKQNRDKDNRCSKVSEKSDRNNKELIMQLRQKQLKISDLQQRLSRKQVEVQSQRQLIQLLMKMQPK